MVQTFISSVATNAQAAIEGLLANTEALRSVFSGGSAPSSPATGQFWADTTTKVLKQYDGSDWQIVGALFANTGLQQVMVYSYFPISGTTVFYIPGPPDKRVVHSVRLVSDTAIAANASNKYEFTLENVDQATDLFSTDPTTEATVSGIGGGAIPAEASYVLLADQNTVVAPDEILKLTVTKTGTPDAIASVGIGLWWYPRGT